MKLQNIGKIVRQYMTKIRSSIPGKRRKAHTTRMKVSITVEIVTKEMTGFFQSGRVRRAKSEAGSTTK